MISDLEPQDYSNEDTAANRAVQEQPTNTVRMANVPFAGIWRATEGSAELRSSHRNRAAVKPLAYYRLLATL
jgi:hypothetical protein